VRGDREWLDGALLGSSVTSYLPIEFGGPPKPCEPVTVYIGYFDVTFVSGRGGGKPDHRYMVEMVDRQRLRVEGTAVVKAEPPAGGIAEAGSCTGRLVVISLGKGVGPQDIKTISWTQYGADGAIGNTGIAFKDNARIARYDLQTPAEAPTC
jgi:hypothetical protein